MGVCHHSSYSSVHAVQAAMERSSSALIQPCEVQARQRFSPVELARGGQAVHGGSARGAG